MRRGPLDKFFSRSAVNDKPTFVENTIATKKARVDTTKENNRLSPPNGKENEHSNIEKNNSDSNSSLWQPVDMLLAKLEPSWKNQLLPILDRDIMQQLALFVLHEREKKQIFPPEDLTFNAFRQCSFKNVKVVIVGQDPYHGPGQAHGLCFSVPNGVKSPPSLENIFKELEQDIPGYRKPSHDTLGNLEHWSKQGVLLLNSVLTVEAHKPGSHANRGWEYFTDQVIRLVNEKLEGVIFLLWGKYAQQKGKEINQKKHYILTAAHPSPYSASNILMIHFLLIINNHGKSRLTKFYTFYPEESQQQLIKECYALVTRRGEDMCSFLEYTFPLLREDIRIIYRHYATLYFICGVDAVESELGILDLIQVFVETLDRCFENVCELDIIFYPDKVHYVLDEMIVGGLVMETKVTEIYSAVENANRQENGVFPGRSTRNLIR
eukprot:jgi/Galph1/3709/GphlegSOOS_G2338.1